jgi:hypothetical protein
VVCRLPTWINQLNIGLDFSMACRSPRLKGDALAAEAALATESFRRSINLGGRLCEHPAYA